MNDFKIGDKVYCISHMYPSMITYGRCYTITDIRMNEGTYEGVYVISNTGEEVWFFDSRFVAQKEYRKMKLKSLEL